jgi:hypothetical protein
MLPFLIWDKTNSQQAETNGHKTYNAFVILTFMQFQLTPAYSTFSSLLCCDLHFVDEL